MQVHVGQPKTWDGPYPHTLRKLLDQQFSEPKTLEDIELTQTAVEQVQQTIFNVWSHAPTTSTLLQEVLTSSPLPPSSHNGPFANPDQNAIWNLLASAMQEDYGQLADLDMLEPDPASRKAVMQHP